MTTETSPAAPTQALTRREPLGFIARNFDELWRQADMFSKSNLLPDTLKNKPNDVLVVLATGAELGLSPMQSLREVYVVKGKGYISSLLKVALVKQSPNCEWFRLVESTAERATFETKRKGEGVTKMSFTMEEAKLAGLAGRPRKEGAEPSNWDKYPALMLRRRCENQLADEVYPDETRGIGNEDDTPRVKEVNAAPTYAPPPRGFEEEGQVIPPTPPAPATKAEQKPADPPPTPTQSEAVRAAGGITNSDMDRAGSPPVEREPGSDDGDVPASAAPVDPPGEDLAVFAALQAIRSNLDAPDAEDKLNVLSPRAQLLKGPMRGEIIQGFADARAILKAKRKAKAGK